MATRTKKVDLTEQQIVAATLNSPELSEHSIILQGRTFKIIDLEYDAYMKFTLYLKPIFKEILSKAAEAQSSGKSAINFTLEDFNIDRIFEIFGSTLPDMALLCLQATEPSMTVEECKRLCKTPFKMLEIVLLQISKNNIIQDFTSFFPHLTRLM